MIWHGAGPNEVQCRGVLDQDDFWCAGLRCETAARSQSFAKRGTYANALAGAKASASFSDLE